MNPFRILVACLPAMALPLMLATPVPAAEPVSVFVSILPQRYFVERIGQDRVSVQVLVAPGASPATYEPTPRQMSQLEQAQVYFSIGVPFESTLLRSLAGLRSRPPIFATSGSAMPPSQQPVQRDGHGDGHAGAHDHGHQNDHHHGHHHGADGIDPHTWLSIDLALAQADSICSGLCRIDPEGAAEYRTNLAALRDDLQRLRQQNRELLAPYRGGAFVVFHPAFGHFAREHGLIQLAVESDGHEPGARHLGELIERVRQLGVKHVVVQPQFSRKTATTIARAVDAELVELDPLAVDYLDNLARIAGELRRILAAAATHGAPDAREVPGPREETP